jgi:hypothetical protein
VDCTVWGSNPGRGIYFSPPKRPDWLGGQPSFLFSRYRRPFKGVRQSGHEVNLSPPSSAEDHNEGSYTSTPPVSILGVDRNSFAARLKYTEVCNSVKFFQYLFLSSNDSNNNDNNKTGNVRINVTLRCVRVTCCNGKVISITYSVWVLM